MVGVTPVKRAPMAAGVIPVEGVAPVERLDSVEGAVLEWVTPVEGLVRVEGAPPVEEGPLPEEGAAPVEEGATPEEGGVPFRVAGVPLVERVTPEEGWVPDCSPAGVAWVLCLPEVGSAGAEDLVSLVSLLACPHTAMLTESDIAQEGAHKTGRGGGGGRRGWLQLEGFLGGGEGGEAEECSMTCQANE